MQQALGFQMPLSRKGKKIKRALTAEYGKERGERILYAGKNKGTFKGIDARRRKVQERDPFGREGSTYQEEDCDYRFPFSHATYDREFTAEQRKKAASEGEAMRGGGFPIKNKKDLANARQALGRAKNRSATIAHIKKRAKALGAKLPEGWPGKDAETEFTGTDPYSTGAGAHAVGQKRKKKRPDPGNASEPDQTGEFVSVGDSLPYLIVDGPTLVEDHGRLMHDAIEFDDAAKVQFTEEGYLKAVPRICRTGIQLYAGDECGMPEMRCVRVFRPEDQVFKISTMHGYARLPITLEHPGVQITSDNWRDYAVGETGDEVTRDGTTVRVPFMLRDARAVQAFKDGKNQLSVGYVCDLKWQDGETPDGEVYDAIQTNIRPNHLAVVAAARGGSTLKIGDQSEGESDRRIVGDRRASGSQSPSGNNIGDTNMTVKMTVDGLQCTLADEQSAAIIQRTIDNLRTQIDAFKKKSDKDDDDKEEAEDALQQFKDDFKKAVEAKDGEIAMLKKDLAEANDPAKQDAKLKDRMTVLDKARQIYPRVQIDGKDLNDVRRQVVCSQAAEAKDWSDGQIEGAFNYMASKVKSSFVPAGNTQMGDVVRNFQQHMPMLDARTQAYEDYDRADANAWRKPGKAQSA